MVASCLLDPGTSDLDDFFLGYATTSGTVITMPTDSSAAAPTTPADSLTDNGDGTVTSVRNGVSLMYAKCNQGTGAGNTRYGGGGAADPCTSGTVFTGTFCNGNNNTCNGGTDTGTLDGGGVSQAFASCAGLSLGGHTDWRVATISELLTWRFVLAQAAPDLFPNFTSPDPYWSANSLDTTQAFRMTADGVIQAATKVGFAGPIRCVRNP